jgi:hypothetical protein
MLVGFYKMIWYYIMWPIPVAALSKAWIYGLSLAGIVGSNPD